ncbi:M48 family metalloprotease [Microbulbifer thermotolerans]|uniref:M48 family metalloprotease n=1 Tax=Microbulbifer thermotolerans TaxID=252514 RepID=UPI002248C68C|nr:M48 family metalloprotease [Microbulbifer thermotolerans]MCX2832429.1 M48 family metalloprotease [Microbulbifer thermotolerans]WKT61179.1 M48 family metalloprotease [Microbulbifer thermotolerans]
MRYFNNILIAILIAAAPGCAFNPATNRPDLVLMSEEKEIEIGREMHKKLIASTPIYNDPVLTAYVNHVGQKIAAASDRPDLNYHFTIIDSQDINAFALPGGYVYINRGLLTYLHSEAEMAAVLAHEIGHITARHAVRQKTAATGAGVASVLSVLVTGSGVVGDVTNLWSTAAVKGYGREMELEADRFGAQYMYNAGYDPQAMINVIGLLKDQETFARRRARLEGKKPQTYHGVFSTHPRNDIRLQEVVEAAGQLPEDRKIIKADYYREKTDGLVYGHNVQQSDKNRYNHKRLGFSLLFPKGWKVENQRSAIVGTAPDNKATITIRVAQRQNNQPADMALRETYDVRDLEQDEKLHQYQLVGHTGRLPDADSDSPDRVAVIYYGSRQYILEGKINDASAHDAETFNEYDNLFLTSIRSFRPLRKSDLIQPDIKRVRYVKANEKTTFSSLARHMEIGEYAEEQLRLLNGYYPRGEPKPGEWIKIVQ